ncbi:MAG TPA: fumarylacetoacetate hydrolase family protein [Steroidobacteraceae bacterium]|nr:fumarylacetoacetate hydrolase family protein [Steroidobacteraceae bacterium]
MKQYALGTFSVAGSPPFAGVVIDAQVLSLQAVQALARSQGQPFTGATVLELLEHWEANQPALRAAVAALATPAGARFWQQAVPASALRIHAPLQPRQIFGASANYRKHVIDLIMDQPVAEGVGLPEAERRKHAEALMDFRAQSGKPFAFSKLPSSMVGPNDDVILPFDMEQPDWELELAVVIGKPARRVSKAEALDYVAGYTIGNDLTGREMLGRPDIPSLGHDWIQGKCAPTFLTFGPYLVPREFVPDPQQLQIVLKLNGQTMQDESTNDMIFPVARLIEWLSTHVQLLPGDVILTGSPSGNGTHYQRFLKAGDVMDASITGLGAQRNLCVDEQPTASQSRVRFQKVGKFQGRSGH